MKAQAALEFLMTYGWAILIVIAVGIALYTMGVFKKPGALAPCTPPCFTGTPFAYVDHNADNLVLQVGQKRVNVTEIASSKCPLTSIGIVGEPNTQITITATGCFGGSGNNVQINYKDLESGLSHTVNVTLNGP